ncbi:MAG: hypothetical protein HFH91_21045 [Lachnospiraceae bacterium]|nr:hypothetical protein [Lachnospiraceae bacterium]
MKLNHKSGCALPSGPVSIELRDVWYRYDGIFAIDSNWNCAFCGRWWGIGLSSSRRSVGT